jgi:GntR family transcriptional repressor for pyruvate dehydrogenase complex
VPVTQVIFDQLLAEIRDGRLRPGDRLPTEAELVNVFGVGRSSLRESLRALVTLGLIETKPGRGAIVAELAGTRPLDLSTAVDIEMLNRRELLDLLEVREAVEGKAAELAAIRADADDLKRIREQEQEVRRRVAEGRAYFGANVAFHTAIANASHNRVVVSATKLIAGQVRGFRERLMRELPLMPERDVREHKAIVAAIARRDPEAARAAVIVHMRSFSAVLKAADAAQAERRRVGSIA